MTLAHRLPTLLWKPTRNFSSRHGARLDKVVLHSTEGSYASAVSWFENPASRVSAHFILREDGLEATQMVHLADKAWHVCSYNATSVGIEMAGHASKGFAEDELLSAAGMTAYLLHYLQIPLLWARRGVGPGFCRHYDLGKAGGGHSDPITNDDVWAAFIAMVGEAYDQVDVGVPWIAHAGEIPPDPSTPIGLQAALNALGARPVLSLDGDIGPKTRAAIMAFQKQAGLPANGGDGPETIVAIAEAIKRIP